ncbi:hypothetical protein LXL04_023623 [Taraxacum kok-saghyz]
MESKPIASPFEIGRVNIEMEIVWRARESACKGNRRSVVECWNLEQGTWEVCRFCFSTRSVPKIIDCFLDSEEAGMAEADSVVDESSVVTVSVVAALTKDLLTKLFYHNHVDFESRCIANFAEVSALVDVYEGEAVTKLINEKIPYFNASIYLQNKTQIGKVDEIFGLKGSQSDGRIFGHLPDIYARAPVLPMAIRQDTIVAIRKRDAWGSEKLLRLANVNDKYTMCTYPVHPDQNFSVSGDDHILGSKLKFPSHCTIKMSSSAQDPFYILKEEIQDSVSRPFKLPLRYSSLIKTCYVPQIHALQGTFHQLELTPVANGSQNRLTKEVISKCESIEWQEEIQDSVSRPFKLPLRYSSLIKTCYVPQIHALQGTFHQLEHTPVANGAQNRLIKEVLSKCESIEWQAKSVKSCIWTIFAKFFLTMLTTGFKVARTADELNKWQDFMTKSTLDQSWDKDDLAPCCCSDYVWDLFCKEFDASLLRLRDCAAVLGVFAQSRSLRRDASNSKDSCTAEKCLVMRESEEHNMFLSENCSVMEA